MLVKSDVEQNIVCSSFPLHYNFALSYLTLYPKSGQSVTAGRSICASSKGEMVEMVAFFKYLSMLLDVEKQKAAYKPTLTVAKAAFFTVKYLTRNLDGILE